MAYKYTDPKISKLFDDIACLISGECVDRSAVKETLLDLAASNSPAVSDYWLRTERGRGIPDTAFRGDPLYLFPDEEPARVFTTSGTTGSGRGRGFYSVRGLALMNLSIHHNARRHVIGSLERPIVVRFVPCERDAPEMIMAYGMERISEDFGDPDHSSTVIGPQGVDFDRLRDVLNLAEQTGQPVVMIGGSFVFVNVCDRLESAGRRWHLPAGSRAIDAGGFKGRSRVVDIDTLRAGVARTFGIAPSRCINLFGMTELASQLYDSSDSAVGPLRERPKGALPFVEPCVLNPENMARSNTGLGLLEVMDYCIIDRPPVVLTGDLGIATPEGVAIIGRAERGQSRGCSLTLDAITRGGAQDG